MAYEQQGANTFTGIAGSSDLTQYTFVAATTGASSITLSTATSGSSGVAAVGVVQNAPTSGKAATVWVDGISKVVAGGAIVPGQAVKSDNSGKAVAAAAGTPALGRALTAAANDNDIVSVLLVRTSVA